MAHPVCATGTWSRTFLGPEFGWVTTQSHNLTPRFRQKLSELSKVEPAEDRLSELVLVALGGNETFYVAYKTRKGDYRQDSFDLNAGLHAFLFPKDGTTRDFATLQVVMNWGWTYYAQDKNGRVFEKLPPNLEKAVKERSEQSQWPRTLALGPNYTYVYIGRDEHTEIFLAPHQKELQVFLEDAEKVKGVEYLFLDPYNDWRNYVMCFSDGTWTAFLHAQIFNGQLNEAVKRVSGRVGGENIGVADAASKDKIAKLLLDKETAERELKESQERYEADLKRSRDEAAKKYERLQTEHDKELPKQTAANTSEDLRVLKAQHQKELQDQKDAFEKKLRAKGTTSEAGLQREEHIKEVEKLKKEYEEKLAARTREVTAVHTGLSPMAAAMPALGSMSMMFRSGEYQLGNAVKNT